MHSNERLDQVETQLETINSKFELVFEILVASSRLSKDVVELKRELRELRTDMSSLKLLMYDMHRKLNTLSTS